MFVLSGIIVPTQLSGQSPPVYRLDCRLLRRRTPSGTPRLLGHSSEVKGPSSSYEPPPPLSPPSGRINSEMGAHLHSDYSVGVRSRGGVGRSARRTNNGHTSSNYGGL